MKLRFGNIFLLLTLLFMISCAMNTNVRLHPELVDSPGTIKHLTILPPIAYVELLDMKGNNNTDEEREIEIAGILQNVAPKIMEILNYKSTVLIPDDSQNNLELDREIEGIWSSYILTLPVLYPRREKIQMKEATKFRSNIPMNQFSSLSKTSTDAVLLISYRGFKQSGGRQASIAAGGIVLGLATGTMIVPIPEGGSITAALISSTTGNILWNNHASLQNYSLNNLIAKLFLNFPEQSEDLKQKIDTGESISHQFDIEKLNSDLLFKIKMGQDEIVLADSTSITGNIVKINKKEISLARGRKLYVIKRENIISTFLSDILKQDDELNELKLPRVNYNHYQEITDID